MNLALLLIAFPLLAAAAGAMLLRNLIHSALLFVGSWVGIAAFYLWAGAEFVAFAQVLVYVGAVSMIVLFAVLLTRQGDVLAPRNADDHRRTFPGIVAAVAVAAVLLKAIFATPFTGTESTASGDLAASAAEATAAPVLTVKALGLVLLENHAAALLVVGLILTVALLGAAVIASVDKPLAPKPEDHR